jgi:hypothetical protein
LRYLAGGSYLDVIACAGISKPAFYACIYKGIDAICNCLELALHMPSTIQELLIAAHEFTLLSLDARLNGCIAALDGWLCCLVVLLLQQKRQMWRHTSRGTINNMDLMFKQHVTQISGLHQFLFCVLEVQVIVKHFKQVHCIHSLKTYLQFFTLLLTMHIVRS